MYWTVETEQEKDRFAVLVNCTSAEGAAEIVRVLLRETVCVTRVVKVTRHPEDPPNFLVA